MSIIAGSFLGQKKGVLQDVIPLSSTGRVIVQVPGAVRSPVDLPRRNQPVFFKNFAGTRSEVLQPDGGLSREVGQ